MAEWMEGLVEQYARPIRESGDQTASDLEDLQNTVEALRQRVESTEGPNGEAEELGEGLTQENGFKATEKATRAEVLDEDSSLHYYLKESEEDKTLEEFKSFVKGNGHFYDPEVLRKVWTHCNGDGKRLAILAGPPGCGKSSLVRLAAEFFNSEAPDDARGQGKPKPGWSAFYLLQPVSPSWFSSDELLGSVSAIDGTFRYTQFLKFLIQAEEHFLKAWGGPGEEKARSFFVCLDEFNTAHPKQYLSDILSRMEAEPLTEGRRLRIGSQSTRSDQDTSTEVHLTTNLKLFATINTDATTKNLSPMVLDRSMYVSMTPRDKKLEEAADHFYGERSVTEAFHNRLLGLLPELNNVARMGHAPIGFRGLEQAYAYAEQHPETESQPETVVEDVLVSFFLSKLPGAYAVNDPDGAYLEAVEDAIEENGEGKIHKYDGARKLLERIALGLPGQAAL